MNINIYIEDELGKEISLNAKVLGRSRNSVIREALKEWLLHHKTHKWPKSVKNFTGLKDFPEFESYRSKKDDIKDDPFK